MNSQEFKKHFPSASKVYTCNVKLFMQDSSGVISIYDNSYMEKTWKEPMNEERFLPIPLPVYNEYFKPENNPAVLS